MRTYRSFPHPPQSEQLLHGGVCSTPPAGGPEMSLLLLGPLHHHVHEVLDLVTEAVLDVPVLCPEICLIFTYIGKFNWKTIFRTITYFVTIKQYDRNQQRQKLTETLFSCIFWNNIKKKNNAYRIQIISVHVRIRTPIHKNSFKRL